MADIPVLPVPREELDRVATANVELTEVARALANLAERARAIDPQMSSLLQAQIEKIVHASNTVSSAVKSAYYLTR